MIALCIYLMKCAVTESSACEICDWIGYRLYIYYKCVTSQYIYRWTNYLFLPLFLTLILWLHSLLRTCIYRQHRWIKTASPLCRRIMVLPSQGNGNICNLKAGSLEDNSGCLYRHHLWKEINRLGCLVFLKKNLYLGKTVSLLGVWSCKHP